MKKVWYLYRNGLCFGQRDDAMTAIREICQLSDKEIPSMPSLVIASGQYNSGEYSTIKEKVKY